MSLEPRTAPPEGRPDGSTPPAVGSSSVDPTGPATSWPTPSAGQPLAAPPRRATLPPESSGGHRGRLLVVVLVALLVVAGVVVWAVRSRAVADAPASSAAALSTATVTRTTLTETTSYDGTLTYADSRTVSARSVGTLTWLPAANSTVVQGKPLYRINASPTYLMYGPVPMYRSLSNGVTAGDDVRQLEVALKALGYDPDAMVVDGTFTSSTTAAVEAWQTAVGFTADGVVTAAEVQFLPGAVRVGSLTAAVGDTVNNGSSLYSASGTGRVATVSLSSADSTVAKVGGAVTVSLPSGATVPGHVTGVTTVASSSSSGSGSGNGGGGGGTVNQQGAGASTTSAKVAVTVTVDDPKARAAADQTPVTVSFTSNTAARVLAVPVTALLALAGGGYAVEVVDPGGATHLVAVTPGLYAVGGLVEVTGPGLAEGTTVVVPATS